MRYVVGLNQFGGLVCALSLATGCSLASHDTKSIQIVVPDNSGRASTMTLGDTTPPTSLDDFTCFGINVSGPGIGPNPNFQCSDPAQTVSIVGGLIPATGGAIIIDVPVGPGRKIQLMGLKTASGFCPDLNTYLSSTNGGQTAGDDLGKPYLLAETTTDIVADTSVTLTASFDAANPKVLFESCDDPGTTRVPLTAAFMGGITAGTGSTGVDSTVFTSTATPIPAPTPFTAADFSKVFDFEDETSPGVFPVYTAADSAVLTVTGGNPSLRAAMELHFDISGINLNQNPVFDFDVEYAESRTGCSAVSPSNAGYAQAGFRRVDGVWETGPQTVDSNSQLVRWGMYRPTTVNFIPAGSTEMVVRVDSNIIAGFSCNVTLALGGARLNMHQTPKPLTVSLNAGSPTPVTNLTTGTSYNVNVNGGLPPYQFGVSAGTGITAATGGYWATYQPQAAGNYVMTVTDSAGKMATTSFSSSP